MNKVKKIDSPVLVIGIGGTGINAVLRVKHDFAKRFEAERYMDGTYAERPPRTEYLVIDGDTMALEYGRYGMTLEDHEKLYIGGNPNAMFGAIIDRPYIREWVDPDIMLYDGTLYHGRQTARLILFDKIENVITQLMAKLSALTNRCLENVPVQVKVISGMCGATSSGVLMDLAYIIRYAAAEIRCDVDIEAYLMMPDVTIAHCDGHDPVMARVHNAIGFSLLKDLNFWMKADAEGIEKRQQYNDNRVITWKGKPFDNVYFMCARNDRGGRISDVYEHNIGIISENLVRNFERATDGNTSNSFSAARNNCGAFSNNRCTFQTARANMKEINNNVVNPHFHALGAYSSAGIAELTELKEWGMIYDEAVTRIEKNFVQMEGADPIAFLNAVLTFEKPASTPAGSICIAYNKRHPLPSMEIYDLQTLRDYDEMFAPHGSLYRNFSTKLMQSHGDEELQLTDDVWNVFVKEAQAVCEDIERGPEYLLDMLRNGQNSISVQLEHAIRKIENMYLTVDGMRAEHEQMCHDKFTVFDECSFIAALFRKGQYYDEYMSEVDRLFDATRASCYYKALLTALKNFRNKLARYIAVLSDLVTAIRMRQWDIKRELERVDISATPLDVVAMSADLAQLFSRQTCSDTLVSAMYNSVFAVSMRCMWDTIPVDQLHELLDEAVDPLRESQFSSVGGMSLEQKICAYGNDRFEGTLSDYVKGVLCPMIDRNASPMFDATAEADGLPDSIASRIALITVPAGATIIEQAVEEYCAGNAISAVIKHAPNEEISWINDKCGISPDLYEPLTKMRDDYNSMRHTITGLSMHISDEDDV